MKKINLRDYYPYYTQDMIVEVPDEVADILREYKLAEAAYFLRTYRHKAYFSLDYDINVEHEAILSGSRRNLFAACPRQSDEQGFHRRHPYSSRRC